MTDLSDRRSDAFDNPTKMACRDGNLRVLPEAAYRPYERIITMSEVREV
jgi:hypothetical protein